MNRGELSSGVFLESSSRGRRRTPGILHSFLRMPKSGSVSAQLYDPFIARDTWQSCFRVHLWDKMQVSQAEEKPTLCLSRQQHFLSSLALKLDVVLFKFKCCFSNRCKEEKAKAFPDLVSCTSTMFQDFRWDNRLLKGRCREDLPGYCSCTRQQHQRSSWTSSSPYIVYTCHLKTLTISWGCSWGVEHFFMLEARGPITLISASLGHIRPCH